MRIESLLSARLFLSPQRVGERLFFISNLSGKLSLYAMDVHGSVPEPLLPPNIALQNPLLMDGYLFYVFPKLDAILVMIDRDGDEFYRPMRIPIGGGLPEPVFGPSLAERRVHLGHCDPEQNKLYLVAEARHESKIETFQCDLASGEIRHLGASPWGNFESGVNADHSKVALIDSYTTSDHVLYLWEEQHEERRLLYGQPLEARQSGEQVPHTGIHSCQFTAGDRGLFFITALFDDSYGLGYLSLANPEQVQPVTVTGLKHEGQGEMTELHAAGPGRYWLKYNIDGCSWVYEGAFEEDSLTMMLDFVICGQGDLGNGVAQSVRFDENSDSYALAFSSATSPAQIYTVEGPQRERLMRHTRERVLGIPGEWLSPGEDASFDSHDGLRVSARLYLPAPALNFKGPRPLVYYLHGGPQSQEKPDFTWFSMPLIQFLSMKGFAVFVPNARGSTGYGLKYMKLVDRDWGGDDRLDHVHAMKMLAEDPRVDQVHAGVVGRSYGGYMTLTLAGRHPELWSAAVDMFGPYDLLHFLDRIPETWKPYFKISIGDAEIPEQRAMLVERSPRTYLHQLACPMLVIQGKNDPRVVEKESRELVAELRAQDKEIEYLMFEDEGHDVIKFENRVRCYNAIADFFEKHLMSEQGQSHA